MTGWTTVADVTAKVRRRWDDASLLTALAAGDAFPSIELPVRGPRAGEIGEALAAVQAWAAELEAGSRGGRRYEIVYAAVGGRHYGRNQLPSRIRLTDYDQAWAVLGVAGEVERFRRILELTQPAPAVRDWVAANPLRALEFGAEWEALLAARAWLDGARGTGQYLRTISAPGVDTKFVERHRVLLAQVLGVERSPAGFLTGLGLQAKPDTLRLRFAPGTLGMPQPLTEGVFRVAELAALAVSVGRAVVVENEITYLSVPVPADGLVVWGKGFDAGRVGALPWLRGAEVWYWGDLDTHGFAILDQVRAWLPQTRSVLMDTQTLLAHRDRWGRDPAPTSARLTRLTAAESQVYEDLVTDRLGEGVRLEQERTDWAWAAERLTYPIAR